MPQLLLVLAIVGSFDADVSNAIRRDTGFRSMNYVMQGFSLLSDARYEAALQLGVFYFGNDEVSRNARLAATAWGASGVTAVLLKGLVNRDRPDHSQSSRWNSSFPSGHTISWFSLATAYAIKYPKLIAPLAVIGAGVAYSRVYFGKHYPTDVLAGAALGIGIGWLTLKLEPQLRRIPFLH
jgi:membrane-associated phospholipid phosphatase